MAEILVTVSDTGEAYVGLAGPAPPEVRTSVALDALDEAEALPALDSLVLDFDYYGRLVGIRVTSAAASALSPALLDGARPT
jgi:HEAT repeat protein